AKLGTAQSRESYQPDVFFRGAESSVAFAGSGGGHFILIGHDDRTRIPVARTHVALRVARIACEAWLAAFRTGMEMRTGAARLVRRGLFVPALEPRAFANDDQARSETGNEGHRRQSSDSRTHAPAASRLPAQGDGEGSSASNGSGYEPHALRCGARIPARNHGCTGGGGQRPQSDRQEDQADRALARDSHH